MNDPLISVVVANYNYSQYLQECIDSVINQTYQNWELILVDDNSTDDSFQIMSAYQEKYPEKIIVLKNVNGPSGNSVPLNMGIKIMKGDYFAWLSSDDYFETQKLERQINYMLQNNLDFSCTWYNIIDENSLITSKNSLPKPDELTIRNLLNSNIINGSTVIVKKNIFEELGLFIESNDEIPDIWRVNDYIMWLKILFHKKKAGVLCEYLHNTRRHSNNFAYNTSNFSNVLKKIAIAMIFDEYSKTNNIIEYINELVNSGLSHKIPEYINNFFNNHKEYFSLKKRISDITDNLEFVKFFILENKKPEKYLDNIKKLNNDIYFLLLALIDNIQGNFNLSLENLRKYNGNKQIDKYGFLKIIYDEIYNASSSNKKLQAHEIFDLFILDIETITDVNNLYQIASKLKRKGYLEISLKIFSKILNLKNIIDKLVYLGGAAFHLGEIYLMMNNKEEAIKYFTKCLNYNPAHIKCREYLTKLKCKFYQDEKKYWDITANENVYKTIADVETITEFKYTGKYDALMILRHNPEINRESEILEIGCGIGRIMKPLSHYCKRIFGIDLSTVMIEKAKEYMTGIFNFDVKKIDNSALPFDDSSFDLVYSILVFLHIPFSDFQKYIKESHRVLKENGILFFQVIGDFANLEGVDRDCNIIGNVTHKYSKEELLNLCSIFKTVDVFTDKLDRYDGKYWYFVKCKK